MKALVGEGGRWPNEGHETPETQKEEFNKNLEMVNDVKGRCKLFMVKLCEEKIIK